MEHTIDTAAEQAREAARTDTGKFGTQSHADSGIVDTGTALRADIVHGVNSQTAGKCTVRNGTYGCDRDAGHTVGKHRGGFWSAGVFKIARFADSYSSLTVERSKIVNRCPVRAGTYGCDLEAGHPDDHEGAFRSASDLKMARFADSDSAVRTSRLNIDA